VDLDREELSGCGKVFECREEIRLAWKKWKLVGEKWGWHGEKWKKSPE
jgi:hypothetical protein